MRSADGDELTFKVLLKCKTTKIKKLCWFMILQMVQTFVHGSSMTCYEVINSYWKCTGATNFWKLCDCEIITKLKKKTAQPTNEDPWTESYILSIADACACSPHFYTNMARTRLEQSLLWSNCRLFFLLSFFLKAWCLPHLLYETWTDGMNVESQSEIARVRDIKSEGGRGNLCNLPRNWPWAQTTGGLRGIQLRLVMADD